MAYTFDLIFDAITRRRIPSVVPLYEHFADDQIIEKIMGFDFSQIAWQTRAGQLEVWSKRFEFYRQMGYTYVPVEMGPRFASRESLITDDTAELSKGKRGWVNEHDGVIQTWADLDNPAYWPTGENAFDYEQFEALAAIIPAGMKIIGGASGGPFEHASFLTGVERLSVLMYDDPAFVERLFDQIGRTLVEIAARLAPLEAIGVYRFGDDLGFKTSTMLSVKQLRKYVFPWQKKVVAAVHAAGKPFLLHSCGNLERIMDDLIDDVGIDAKHSYEDVIMPVAEVKKRWGQRLAILGGVDVDYLCRHTPEEIREYTLRILEACAPGGGYAAGTGNTVANYVPVENYLAMLRAVEEFNGHTA
jgi:uroporphyrinogen decarboxylase